MPNTRTPNSWPCRRLRDRFFRQGVLLVALRARSTLPHRIERFRECISLFIKTVRNLLVMTTYERPFGRNFEDFEVGDIYRHWPGKTITEYDDHLFCMITMNHHPLHTNDWYAQRSVQGRNVVVGNLVYSLVLGMSVADVSGAAIANLEVETLKHSKPTFHGDTIFAETRVLEKTLTSKGDRGIVAVETKGINQRSEEVCYFKRKVMVWTREAAAQNASRERPYESDAVWS